MKRNELDDPFRSEEEFGELLREFSARAVEIRREGGYHSQGRMMGYVKAIEREE